MWMYLIAGFYLFCFIIIVVFLWSVRVLARSRFRSEDEGCTVQIGYEEDSQGKVIPTELGSAGDEEAHAGGEAVMHTPEH
jgi:hypothetical protein